jgi:ABC-type transport system involved in multi-copper enzyme maturation permease subunit
LIIGGGKRVQFQAGTYQDSIFTEEKNSGTEKIRLTQPVRRINILLAKLGASLVYIFAFLIATALVSYLLAGLLGGGFGSIHYPVEIDIGYISTIGPVGKYVALAGLLYCLYLLVIISCITLLAAIVKETSIVAVLGIFLITIGSRWQANASHFNPFSFLNFQHFFTSSSQCITEIWIAFGIALGISSLLTLLAHYVSTTTWGQNLSLSPKEKEGNKELTKYEKKRALPLPYFRFEVLKIMKRKTVVVPFILLLVFTMLYGFEQYSQYERFRDSELAIYRTQAESYWDSINRLQRGVAEGIFKPEMVEETLADNTDTYNMYLNAIEAFERRDTAKIAEGQKSIFKYETSNWGNFYPPDTISVYCATQDEIIKRQVQTVHTKSPPLGGLISSPFAMESDLKHIKSWHIRNSQPSITYIFNSLFKNGLAIIALAIFAVSLSVGFSDETHDTRTICLLNTQPLHRKRIYFGKLLAQSAVFISMILIIAAVFCAGLGIAGSPLEKNFPAVQYLNQVDGNYSGVKLWRANLREFEGKAFSASSSGYFVGFTFRDMLVENIEMVALLILSGLVMVAFAMFASQKIRHKIGVSLGTVLIFGMGYLASRYALRGAGIIFPFIWLNQPLVATGEASMIFDVNILNSLVGIAILALWLAALVFVDYKMFSKTGRYL